MMRFVFALISLPLLSLGQTTVLLETFEAGMPVDWELINNDGNTPHPSVAEYIDAWIVVDDPDNSSNKVVSSTSYFQPVDRADRWLITPNVTLGNGGNFISWYGKSHDPSFPDSYKVLISTTGTAIEDFQDTLMLVTNETPDWLKRETQIEGFEEENVHVAFVITSFNGFKLYIDSIHIRVEDPLDVASFEFNTPTINVFPNPAKDFVRLNASVPLESVEIIGLNGQLVSRTEEFNGEPIAIHHLLNGVYMIQASTSSGTVIRTKLVVSR